VEDFPEAMAGQKVLKLSRSGLYTGPAPGGRGPNLRSCGGSTSCTWITRFRGADAVRDMLARRGIENRREARPER